MARRVAKVSQLCKPSGRIQIMSREEKRSDIDQLRDLLLDRGIESSPPTPSPRRFGSLPPPAPLAPHDPLLTRLAPLLELLFLVRNASSSGGTVEDAVLRGAARTLGSDLKDAHISALLSRFREQLREHGLAERLAIVAESLALDRVGAESAYALAATMAIANGEVHEREREFLADVASQLGISKKRASELFAI
jgi:hypothetical protein